MTVDNEHTVLADNPYWQGDKPHIFDAEKIEELCLSAFETYSTSTSLYAQYVVEDEDHEDEGNSQACLLTHPSLIGKHREKAEVKISSALLSLAVAFRTFYDTLEEGDAVKEYVDKNFDADFLCWMEPDRKRNKTSLREACNKIIHARDVRPVYDKIDDVGANEIWMMDGVVELQTDEKGKEWCVSIILPDFLEAIMDFTKYYQSVNTKGS